MIYRQSARVYDALCRGKDYAAAAEQVREIVHRRAPQASTVLDVACGTGRHLEHLGGHFRVEGLDKSPDMLAIARERCPAVRFHEADLVNFSLGRTFDLVTCLFGSIGYATSLADLGRALSAMASHLAPGGVLIAEPWLAPERFRAGVPVLDTVNDPDLKVARAYVTRAEARLSIFDIHYLVVTPDGVSRFDEHHELGLFTDDEYREGFRQAGLEAERHEPGPFGYGLYVAWK